MRLGPNLHRIGNDIVAAYLIVTPDGITVVDAGLPGHWNDLTDELASLGRSLDDIRGLVLTHGDSDHIGFAERLRREHGVPVYVHAADADRAKGGDKPKTPMGPLRIGPTLGFFTYALRKKGFRTEHLTEVVEVADGDVLDLPGSPRIIGLPGHSPAASRSTRRSPGPCSSAMRSPRGTCSRAAPACSPRPSLTSPPSPSSPSIAWPASTRRGCCPAMERRGRARPPTWPPSSEPPPDPR
nr:hypothetical protein GCM10025699_02520 [Microbacterium flavescens]